MARATSYGTCALCGYQSSKAGLTRHLRTCPAEHDQAKGVPSKLFHLRVEGAEMPLYWLDLEIKGDASLRDLDQFLRDIWLECCGHLSAFTIGGRTYDVQRNMKAKLDDVLAPGTTFEHEYDFGSTTCLTGKVVAEREGRIGREPLRLLARNDAPVWDCQVCGRPATQIHTEEMWDSENSFYCQEHMEASGEDDYLFLPVVNSPRMGVCGYEG